MTLAGTAPLYLPITPSTLTSLTTADAPAVIASMSLPELAAALVVMKLQQMRLSGLDTIEKLLATVISAANESVGDDQVNPLRDVLLRDLDPPLLELMHLQLGERSISLMDASEVARRDYLTALGNWDFEYRYRRLDTTTVSPVPKSGHTTALRFSDPQQRVADTLLLDTSEPLHVQGYAGTGKTYLLTGIVQLLAPPNRPLVLCQTQQQIRAIQKRLPGTQAQLMTFQMLALEALDHADQSAGSKLLFSRPSQGRMSPSAQISDSLLAKHLMCNPVSSLAPAGVANLCRRMVMSFCSGTAEVITQANIPHGMNLTAMDRVVLVEYATALWHQILCPEPGLDIPIRAYHLIKLLALRGYGIPDEYSHVIVDESHDLTAPMLQVLERSHQAFITLGDDMQSQSGFVRRHSSTIRQREIGQAVRAGVEMESVLTPLIEAHPLSPSVAYQGNRSVGTQIRHFDSLKMPSQPTTVLVKDLWGLFEWFLRMSPEDGAYGFELLGNRTEFLRFAIDLIELHNTGSRPRHGLLFRYSDWDQLQSVETAAGNKSFERIVRRLEKGLSAEQFQELFSRTGTNKTSGYRLALVSEVRNMEFDSVMLAPDLLPRPEGMSDTNRGKLLSAIYTGASRTRHELIIPGYLVDWVADLRHMATE